MDIIPLVSLIGDISSLTEVCNEFYRELNVLGCMLFWTFKPAVIKCLKFECILAELKLDYLSRRDPEKV